MTNTAPPNLGVVITNVNVRRAVYAGYIVALVVAGACQVAFAALELAQPGWLTAALAVLAYLGIPVGGLAIANTPTPSGRHAAVPHDRLPDVPGLAGYRRDE